MPSNRYLLWLLLAWPVLELGLMIRIGVSFGLIPVVLWLLIAGTIGLRILQTHSWVIVSRVQQALQTREALGDELLDNALIVAGAVLLIVPGFLSDGVALLCLLPPTRAALARAAISWLPGPNRNHGSEPRTFDGEFRRDD